MGAVMTTSMTSHKQSALDAVRSVRRRQNNGDTTGATHDEVNAIIERLVALENDLIDQRPTTAWTFRVHDSGRIWWAPEADPTLSRCARSGVVEIVDGTLDIPTTRYGDEWGGG